VAHCQNSGTLESPNDITEDPYETKEEWWVPSIYSSHWSGRRTFLRKAAILNFFVRALMYVPMKKAMILKKGTQVCSGKNFCAKAKQSGEVTQLTFMTGKKPALTVALTWW
jgi:hypothetical protein